MFTFGAGGYGQLGHNSTNHEINPRKVFELMGNVVTQISCGRRVLVSRPYLHYLYHQLSWISLKGPYTDRCSNCFATVRQHTLAFTPSSGKMYSFGLGGNGQLGTRSTCNRKSPAPVKGPFVASGEPVESGKERHSKAHRHTSKLYHNKV